MLHMFVVDSESYSCHSYFDFDNQVGTGYIDPRRTECDRLSAMHSEERERTGADLGGCSRCSSTPISCKLDYVTALEALVREVSYLH